jgi:4-amino-4-deoxy-L-arabinose transferase-like glycosyltransferase
MLLWTKLFGHSLLAIRLPSALLGALSIWITYRVARRVTSRVGALLAASLIALSGFHIYWSQMARMYVPAGFLLLLSTLMFLKLHEDNRYRYHLAYGITTAAALWTQLYAWPVIFIQCVWVVLRMLRDRVLPAAAPTLILALVVSMPVVALTLHQNPSTRWGDQAFGFFAMGYSFDQGLDFWRGVPDVPLPDWMLAAATCILILAGLKLTKQRPESAAMLSAAEPHCGRSFFLSLVAAAVSTSCLMSVFAVWVPQRSASRLALLSCAFLPLALAAGFAVVWRLLQRFPSERRCHRAPNNLRLIELFATIPILLMLAVSVLRGVFVARGTILFLPYLMISMAAGMAAMRRLHPLGTISIVATLLILVASSRHFALAAGSPRDYAGLARELRGALRPDDVVFLRKDYRAPPFLYYFDGLHHQFVASDYDKTIRSGYVHRVWVVIWENALPHAPMMAALAGYHRSGQVRGAESATAVLFERDSNVQAGMGLSTSSGTSL